jgi:hypothetical protein
VDGGRERIISDLRVLLFQLTPQGVPGLQAGKELRFTHITLNAFE